MRRFGWLAVVVLLAGGSASARQVLFGARAGAGLGPVRFGVGPAVGVDATVQLYRLLAIEVAVEQSVHFPEDGPGWFSAAAVGLQYRIDVASVVPYVTLGAEGFRVALGADGGFGYGLFLGAGVIVPFRESLFAGFEGRYGASVDGGFPVRQVYFLRLGWRFGAF